MRRHGPELLRDLAWKSPERWGHYEARYGIDPASPVVGTRGDAALGAREGVAQDLRSVAAGQSAALHSADESIYRGDSPLVAPKHATPGDRH